MEDGEEEEATSPADPRNPKLQNPNPKEIPNRQSQNPKAAATLYSSVFWLCDLNLPGIWGLGFGASRPDANTGFGAWDWRLLALGCEHERYLCSVDQLGHGRATGGSAFAEALAEGLS